MTLQSRAYEIFKRATDIPKAEVEDFLASECGQDVELRKLVEELLAVEVDASDLLPEATSPPPIDVAEHVSYPDKLLQTMIGPYKLQKQLGEGGFGVVYLATQQEPVRREIALKIIKPGMDSRQVIARFETERQALALMDHPNIAHVFDAGQTDDGRLYFVMELVKGVPITQFCDKHNLNTTERLQLFMSVCRAVQHAHQKGVIHRDLKPSNILVTLDVVPFAKVIDFGVSKSISQRLTEKTLFTQMGQMIGTPQYMSPEQAEMSGLDVDTRSDIYSLGVVLYELLTGTTPLDAERLRTVGYSEMQRIIQEEDPQKPSSRISKFGRDSSVASKRGLADPRRLRQAIKGDLDWIVMKALEKRRDRRYETANGLAADVERHLNTEPVLAGRPTARYRFSKWVRRNRAMFATGTAVLMALVLGLAFATWGFFQANVQSSVARKAEQRAIGQQAKLERQIYLIHLGNVDEAIRAKDYHRADIELGLCQRELRGWEWSFLEKRLQAFVPLQVPGVYWRHPVYSPNGKRLVVAKVPENPDTQDEGKAVVWDLESGQKVGEFEIGSRDWHQCVLVKEFLALLSHDESDAKNTDRKLVVWNTETKQQVWSAEDVNSMMMTADNRLIAAVDDTLKVFDASSGNLLSSLAIDNKPDNWGSLSPDGRWIEASNAEGVSLLAVTTGRIAGELPPNSEGLAFGSDGSIAFIIGHNIFIWKWNEGKAEFEETQTWNGLHNRGRVPQGLSFGANGEHLSATGPRGNFVTIWEVATGKKVETAVAVQAYTASMNPTTSQVAHPIHNGHIRVWNYKPEYDNLTIIPIAHGLARFSPNGKLIAVADDNLVSIRDVASGRVVRSINGRLVDCGTPDQRNGEPWVFDQQQPEHQLIVVYNKQESRLEVWDVDQGKPVTTSQSVYDNEHLWFYVNNDGRRVTTIEKDNQNKTTVRVWNIQTGETSKFATPSFHFHTVWEDRLAFNDQIWDTQRGVEIFKDSSMVYPRSMRFCGNGKRLFRGGYGGVLSLYDIHPSGQPDSEPKQFTGHGGEYDLHYLVLSPDETKLLASDDGAKFQGEVDRAILWDIETALPLMTFEGEAEDWSSDNKHIALSTAEGVHIWTLPPSP